MKNFFLITTLFVFVTLISCGGGSSSSSNGGSAINFYDNAESVMPRVTASTATSISGNMRATWSSGSNLYEVYQLIRSYEYPTDEGHVDGSNMHKSMFEAESNVDYAIEQCGGTTNEDGSVTPSDYLITTQSIASPYDFGSDGLSQTYDCAFTTTETGTPVSGGETTYTKSMAVRQSGTAYYLTMGLYMTNDSADSPSAMQVEYDTDANTITVNDAYLVNYTTGDKYAVRIFVDGDITTHLFSLKLLKGGWSESTQMENFISIAGHGYAEGAGNYYLFKMTTSGIGSATNKYYCFASDTTEDEMMAMEDAGLDEVPAECADLEAGLPGNYAADSSAVPMSTDAFTGGGDYHTELSWTE